MNITELEIKLRRIYIDGQDYNNTAIKILNHLREDNTKRAGLEFVNNSDKIPGWRTWGKDFKHTIMANKELLGIYN